MRTRLVSLVLAAAVVSVVAPVHAAQTVEVMMNGHRHQVTVPDGWRATPQDGGVFIQPPSGRYEGLQVIIVGVPKPKNAVSAIEMANNIAASDKKDKPYLSSTSADPMTFMGQSGAIITLDGVNPQGKRETMVYVMAMSADTTYLAQASGSYDDLVANVQDIRGILTSARIDDSAPVAKPSTGGGGFGTGQKPPPDAPPPPPPPPAEPAWKKEAPLPPPAAKAKRLVDDPMLGVTIDKLEGWGVSAHMNNYAIEKRLDDKSRVVGSIWLGTEKFSGSGNEYMRKVAGDASAEWQRFGGQDAMLVKRPPQFEGAGDVVEVHVLRGETPVVMALRFDGGRWDTPAGREMLAEIDGATKVGTPGKAKGAVAVAGLAKVKAGKGWGFDAYGPGAMASWSKGAWKVRVAVFTRLTMPPLQCDADQSKPSPMTTKLAGKAAEQYECPKDPLDQVFYTATVGDFVVYVGVTAPSGEAPRAALEFVKFLKL
jgi:hypothetical protein